MIGLGGRYDTEDFEGLIQVPESETREDFYRYYSGWMRYRGYVIARDLGVTLSKSIHPIPPGGYQVFLKVYDHEDQGSNQVEVTLNGMSRVVEWAGTEEGERSESSPMRRPASMCWRLGCTGQKPVTDCPSSTRADGGLEVGCS
ncbi:MAG: hypothetical protein E3J21_13490 [Anaerolineales bacterium]|nr:MAG: hypothetical protein E3J21_13490 [Anaerolineales bacterium]